MLAVRIIIITDMSAKASRYKPASDSKLLLWSVRLALKWGVLTALTILANCLSLLIRSGIARLLSLVIQLQFPLPAAENMFLDMVGSVITSVSLTAIGAVLIIACPPWRRSGKFADELYADPSARYCEQMASLPPNLLATTPALMDSSGHTSGRNR